jgi:hypothetical protein
MSKHKKITKKTMEISYKIGPDLTQALHGLCIGHLTYEQLFLVMETAVNARSQAAAKEHLTADEFDDQMGNLIQRLIVGVAEVYVRNIEEDIDPDNHDLIGHLAGIRAAQMCVLLRACFEAGKGASDADVEAVLRQWGKTNSPGSTAAS